MLRLACLLAAAICLLTAACDPELVREPDDDDDDPPPAAPEARVDDCARVGDGVPIAILSGDPFSLASHGASLFYMSEGRIFALPIAEGEPKALTPTGFVGRGVQYADGFVYWQHDDAVYRVPPIALDGTIYFGGHDKGDDFVARVTTDDPGQPERLLSGFAVSMAVDDDALYVNAIPPPDGGETFGSLMRVPLDGSPPRRLSATPTRASIGFELRAAGLVVDDANVYMIDECTDEKPNSFRLVAIPK